MKIILSRKGFDSGYGGMPSPILPDGTMLSMPIPSEGDLVHYCDLCYNGLSYQDIISQLKPNSKILHKECHLDPDIRRDVVARKGGWKPAFGQIGAAQSHLRNQGICNGDVFLFFGWFRHTAIINGRLSYIGPTSGFHAIYGYMQIGNIIKCAEDVPQWLMSHPHACDRRWEKNNAIYIASDHLTLNPFLEGAGCFHYTDTLKLTKEGCSRSVWELPDFFKDIPISYNKKAWKEDGFHSAAKGQEFVFEANEDVLNWLQEIFQNAQLSLMIEHLLQPLVCERFLTDVRYREGHLRVVNALPERRVMGLHSPEIKAVSKRLSREGGEVIMPDGMRKICVNGSEVIRAFEAVPNESLCYEETVIWGYLINLEKCSLDERLAMLGCYVPVLDNWAVCDSYCAHAKWMARADKAALWAFLGQWFDSEREFEVRFAVVVAMCYFLNEEWLDKVFERINSLDFDRIKSKYKTVKGKPKVAQQGTVQGAEPYYVRMGVAWLLATALAKFPDATRAFVRSSNLPEDVVKLYIRKARESFRTRTVEAL